MEELEYNILGSKIKIRPDEGEQTRAQKAIELVNDEIENLKKSNSSLKDLDIAVLVSLKMAAKSLEVEDDFKDTMVFLKGGVKEALSFVDSSGK